MAKKSIITEDDIDNIVKLFEDNFTIGYIRKLYCCRSSKIHKILEDKGFNSHKHTNDYHTSKEMATQRKYYLNEDYFENIDDNTKAYWLGFLYADGYVHVPLGKTGKTKGIKIEIALKGEDAYHLFNFARCIESNYPIKMKKAKCNGKEFDCCRISIGSVKMGKDLIKWGCVPNKSLILKYPYQLDDLYFGDFLRGYFDGDGSVCYVDHGDKYSRRISMNGTFDFLTSIKVKLNDRGIHTENVSTTPSKTYCLGVSPYNYKDFYNLLYGNCDYFLGRKLDMLRKLLKRRKDVFTISRFASLSDKILEYKF